MQDSKASKQHNSSAVEIEKARLELYCALLSGEFGKLHNKFAMELEQIRAMESGVRRVSVH